jgi:hypothetical protein
VDAAVVSRALEEAGIAPDRRPQTLSVGDWLRLRSAFGPLPEDRRGRRADDAGDRPGTRTDRDRKAAAADDQTTDDAGTANVAATARDDERADDPGDHAADAPARIGR